MGQQGVLVHNQSRLKGGENPAARVVGKPIRTIRMRLVMMAMGSIKPCQAEVDLML